MRIEIEPKEIAELFELLTRRESAKEIMETIQDNLPKLTDQISGQLGKTR